MLSLLHIENIAVIEQADIELGEGLTVLSGETGAGKSIVIDAISAILGQRTSRELIRSGAQKGFVSAVFTGIPTELTKKLQEMELNGDEADTVHVQRQISADGKSICRVNMRPVSASVLKSLSPYFINIHGQHDGQKLMDEQYHIEFLDNFGNAAALLAEYTPLYQRLFALKRQITELDKSEQERLQRIDMLRYHAEEIEAAALVPGEDEALAEKKAVFDNAGKLLGALDAAYRALDGEDEDTPGACALLTVASNEISQISGVSGELQSLYERAEELKYLALDLRDSVSAQQSKIDFSPEESAAAEERLDTIYRLKQKYGATTEEILAYYQEIQQELEKLSCADETRERLHEEYKAGVVQAKAVAARLTALRREAAAKLEKRIVAELADLDMARTRFEIRIETGTRLTAHGMDTVAFLISVNPGEPVKPLSKVASGGELSRVMLAMKNVLTAGEAVGTLIFDEIDTGVSGRAAQKIARKLASIAQKKQTLCVTHLPQIAAMGDSHLLIAKSVREGRSYTDVTPLAQDARVNEVARMISGDNITETTRSSAKELLDAAAASKKEENK
ncbi:DNA repair protein RecN [Intestinibacillus massiliensis]|nr:DNA repair protein RecN [Intestinibacillus massiliensis]